MVYIPNQNRGPEAQPTGVLEQARRKKEEEARRKKEEEARRKAKPPPPTQITPPPTAVPPPQQQVPPSPPREAPPPPPTQAPTPPTQVPPSYTPPPAAALPTPPPAATPPPAPPPAAAPTPPTAPPPPPPSAPPQAPAPLPPEVTGDVTPIAPPPGAIERSIPVTGSGEFGETPKEDAGKSLDELINEFTKSLAETKGDLLADESGFADYEKIKAAVRAGEATTTNTEFDTQVRQLMADLLAGRGMDVSTAEEEALIRELMQDKVGQGLVEQRARMGRAGFGASGALAAMESDVRRQAGQQATQETLAIRRQAEQEAINNALRAVGVDIEKRAEARQQMFDEEFLSALQSYLGQEDTGGGGGGGGGGGLMTRGARSAVDLANAAIFNQGVETEQPELAASSGAEGTLKNPIVTGSPPAGAIDKGYSESAGGRLYYVPNNPERPDLGGKYYVVKGEA